MNFILNIIFNYSSYITKTECLFCLNIGSMIINLSSSQKKKKRITNRLPKKTKMKCVENYNRNFLYKQRCRKREKRITQDNMQGKFKKTMKTSPLNQ